jgi:hypothetical protein
VVTPEELARLKSVASEASSKYALALRAYKRQKRVEKKGVNNGSENDWCGVQEVLSRP